MLTVTNPFCENDIHVNLFSKPFLTETFLHSIIHHKFANIPDTTYINK